MEKEMLTKILEEINKVNNKVDSLQIEMNRKFKEMDKKFEGLNSEVKEMKKELKQLRKDFERHDRELKQLRKDFERHDRGEKMAWQEFENNIGDEIERLDNKIDGNTLQLLYVKNAVRSLLNIHKKELNLAEESAKYEADTNDE